MAISKDRLIFDTSEVADSDSVGSFLRASDGTLLTHTDVGGKKALDVRVANTVDATVTATDLDIRDLSAATDSVQIGDGADILDINADGSINAVVTATDLDIRNLAFATDTVDVSGSSVTVSATDLDIRNLAHGTDSVKVGDGTDFLAVNADGSINVSPAAPNAAIATVQVGVTDTGDALPTSALANRKKMIVQNTGSKPFYIGPSGVTVSDGLRISAGANVELEIGPSITLYAITDSSQVSSARVFEIA